MEKKTKEITLKHNRSVPIILRLQPLSWEQIRLKYLRKRLDQLLQQRDMWERDLMAILQKEGASPEDIREIYHPFRI